MKQNKALNYIRKISFVYKPLASIKNYAKDGRIYEKIKFLKEDLEQKGVTFIYCEPPRFEKIKLFSTFDKERLEWIFDFNNLKRDESDVAILKKLYGENISADYIYQLFEGIKVIPWGGGKKVADYQSEYINIVSGIRKTISSDCVSGQYKIHVYGACTARGVGVENGETIESYLQELINKNGFPYQVVNHGIGCGSTIGDDIVAIEHTGFYKGDMVILLHQSNHTFVNYCRKNNILTYCSSEQINKEHATDWFFDDVLHTTRVGNKIIATGLYDFISKKHLFANRYTSKNEKIISYQLGKSYETDNKDLKTFIHSLEKYKIDSNGSRVGAIVMNCNPFTLGHKYLIEEARKQVDYLYIFVVEENKSFFAFEDRIALVRAGTNEFNNVIVIPSGKFIISSLTFPGYFNKENDKTATVDTTEDIELFAKYIAPALNISVRFAGEEPNDMVTNQYNQTMKTLLPVYGIRFVEIPRRTYSGKEVISASTVRKLIKQKDIETIRQIVPATTFEYLMENYLND